ncbi:hypothetical protein [Halobacillus sp. H74]|uniref:hypothetical protein n=1 Tax=Halobacillus sp. H74 TaxID=3457436 RepID=UPI003FCDD8B6
MDVSWTPIITVAGAFSAAFAGQYFGHRFTSKRERINKDTHRLQYLYSPLVHKVMDYLNEEGETAQLTDNPFLDESEVYIKLIVNGDPNEYFQLMRDLIGENLVYANQKLIMLYERGKFFGDYNYGKIKPTLLGPIHTFHFRIEFCSECLSEYLMINESLNTLSVEIKEEVEKSYFFCLILLIMFELRLHELILNHSLRAKLFLEALYEKKGYFEKAKSIYSDFRKFSKDIKNFNNIILDDLEADASELIFRIIKDLKYFEPEIGGVWEEELIKHPIKEEYIENKVLENLKIRKK